MHTNTEMAAQKEVSLKDIVLRVKELIRYILSNWILIGSIGLFSGLLGYTYAYFKEPAYIAATTFVLEDGGDVGLGQYAGLAAIAGIDLNGGGGNIFQGDNLLELYKSRSMIEKALLSPADGTDKLLIDQYIEVNKLREKWQDKKALASVNFSPLQENKFTRLQDSVIGAIVQDINKNYLYVSKPDKKLSIIKVEVKASDESFSKAFNDQIVKTVNEFYIQTKTKKSLENLQILQHQSDSVRKVLNNEIYRGASSIDATPNINPTRQAQRVAPVQQAQISGEVNKAILGELVKNLELTKMSLLKETPLIQIIDTPKFPLQKKVTSKIFTFILFGFVSVFLTVSILLGRKILEAILR